MTGFHDSNGYCEACDRPYEHIAYHRCNFKCPVCKAMDCPPVAEILCRKCNRTCRSAECLERHEATPGARQTSYCEQVYQCSKCHKVIERKLRSPEEHQCYEVKCAGCKSFVKPSEHRCFLPRVPAKAPSDNLIFFDFETDQSTGEHLVNYAVAQYFDGRERVFKGYDALTQFCTWLFSYEHKSYTAIAHNLKGFDGQFVLRHLLEQGLSPRVIPCGSKLMEIELASHQIRLIDSFNFLPVALSKMPKALNIEELSKGYFCHLFNTPENQDYIGELPAPEFYTPESMSASDRAKFYAWHAVRKSEPFNFQEEMYTYCKSDVDILRRCCIEFREQFLEVSGVDPFTYVTIASACMAIFRSRHIQAGSIAVTPAGGYINSTNYSQDSIRWIDYVAASEGLTIKHALNEYGEQKLAGVSVDGYCEATNCIYQYQGCFFHGCETCYERDVINPLNGFRMAELWSKTQHTTEKLKRAGYTVVEKWEHDFAKEKKAHAPLVEFLKTHEVVDRLVVRDSFYGGRTNAIQLYFQGKAKYIDFTSLYPWVNKYAIYPKGHPEVITKDFATVDTYFGIVKCRVIPPRGLYHPVLPYRCNGKLLFPLCRTCAVDIQQETCQHSDQERALVGTWVTVEVVKAVEKGYIVDKIHEVYHFEEKSSDSFKSYIDLFLKIKQEASGWPSHCHDELSRQQYIADYEAREGIVLDNVEKNAGLRQVAKLCLNSFWGRWGMNSNKTQLSFVNNVPEFNKLLCDKTKDIKEIYLPTPEVAAVQWCHDAQFVPEAIGTNVFLAAFTTCYARLKLYSELEKLDKQVLYFDTDSIVYNSTGLNDPPLGDYLGDFTDELDGDTISTFVSGGAKNYAYKTAGGETCCKIRGFTLNYRNSEVLNFDTVESLVKELDMESTISITNPAKITRDAKRRRVVNKEEVKKYRMVYDKRVIQNDYTTLPYGY